MIPDQYRAGVRRLALLAFWSAVIAILFLATMPANEAPDPTGWDKANHALAFYVLTLLAALAYPRRSLGWVALMLCGFGVLIEGVQTIPMLGRSTEFADLLGDIVGVLIGIVPLAIARWRLELADASGR